MQLTTAQRAKLRYQALIETELQRRGLWSIVQGARAKIAEPPYHPRGAAARLQTATDPEIILTGARGTGKAQPLDAIIWTVDGPKHMGDMAYGDSILTPRGSAKIIGIYPQGQQLVYRMTFSGGNEVECTADHLWRVWYRGGGRRNGKKARPMSALLTCGELTNKYLRGKRKDRKYWVECAGAEFAAKSVPISPYVLGMLLGDGYLRNGDVSFTTTDQEIVHRMQAELGDDYEIRQSGGYTQRICAKAFKPRRSSVAKRGYISWHKVAKKWAAYARRPGGGAARYLGLFKTREKAEAVLDVYDEPTHSKEELEGKGIWNDLSKLGLLGKRSYNKFVPVCYKYNSRAIRLELLRGLMDADGTVDKTTGMASFCSTSWQLAHDVKEIIESLGGIARITTKQPSNGQLAYTCWIRYNNNADLFHLQRKKARCKVRIKYPVKHMIADIKPIGYKECQCIEIDSDDGLYLTDHFIPTHNSRAGLSKLWYCMNRWPGARAAIVRKTRVSLTTTGLVTFENEVLGVGHPLLASGPQRAGRSSYKLPNKSEIVVLGMDKPSRTLSSEYDIIFVLQAEELTVYESGKRWAAACETGSCPINS